MEEKIKELEKEIKELKRRVSVLETWRCNYPGVYNIQNIPKVIGKPLDQQWIPEVEG